MRRGPGTISAKQLVTGEAEKLADQLGKRSASPSIIAQNLSPLPSKKPSNNGTLENATVSMIVPPRGTAMRPPHYPRVFEYTSASPRNPPMQHISPSRKIPSDSYDPERDSICAQPLILTPNADVYGIAVTVASEFNSVACSFFLDSNSVLLASDVVVNLFFRAFLHLAGCWLGRRKD